MKLRNSFSLMAVTMILATLPYISCSNKQLATTNADTYPTEVPEYMKDIAGLEKLRTKIDYSKPEHWVSLPQKPTKPVDVFFLYPTVVGMQFPTKICDINDSAMVAGTEWVMRAQASVFAESCNVFVPYYRQISLPQPGSDHMAINKFMSHFDATDALDYFLTHLNQGRPFILAGHSQGSILTINLLADYMTKHPKALSRMVAAYPIGFSVTKEWLEQTGLKFAEGPTDTGVIISWNTEGLRNKNAFNMEVLPGEVSINPINWRRDTTYAPASSNLGSINNTTGKITVPGIADARLDTDRGVVVVTTADTTYALPAYAAPMFGPESYHLYDYGFFYNNLKQNIADRIAAWMRK
ncbi:MAG: DUF3089 domain-containing protein [Muribaculaceae bacterium]|nr:DUF3089 domain-containing protein [Muribaculaceae bacterium]